MSYNYGICAPRQSAKDNNGWKKRNLEFVAKAHAGRFQPLIIVANTGVGDVIGIELPAQPIGYLIADSGRQSKEYTASEDFLLHHFAGRVIPISQFIGRVNCASERARQVPPFNDVIIPGKAQVSLARAVAVRGEGTTNVRPWRADVPQKIGTGKQSLKIDIHPVFPRAAEEAGVMLQHAAADFKPRKIFGRRGQDAHPTRRCNESEKRKFFKFRPISHEPSPRGRLLIRSF